jgi:exopolysaccharide production protein ExoQ
MHFAPDRPPAVAPSLGTAPAKVERHFRYFDARLPNAWWSGAFAFGMGACLLAASAAGQRMGVIGFLALTGIMAALFPHGFVRANARNVILWISPLWGLFSVVWSIDPDRTLHISMLTLPTMAAGLAIGGMLHRRAAAAGLALALTAYIGYSFLYGASVLFSDTGSGGEAFAGITTGKNFFGHLSAITLMMTPIFLLFARDRWTVPVVAITGIFALLSGIGLVKSHATGSIIATLIAFMVLATVLVFRRVSLNFRVVLLAAVLGVLTLYFIFGDQLRDEVFSAILTQFNKDVTLTGRVVLWDYADRLIQTRYWLGFGSGAFWYYTNPEAWTLWRMMGVSPMSGFNFHNTPRDILIDTGMIGLILYVATYGYTLLRTAWRSLASGDLLSAVGLGFIMYFVVRLPVETTGVGALSIDGLALLLFLSLTARRSETDVDVRAVIRRQARHFRD